MYEEVVVLKDGFGLIEVAEVVIDIPTSPFGIRTASKVVIGRFTYFDGLGNALLEQAHAIEIGED